MSDESAPSLKVLVAVASYNERETIPKLLDEIFRALPSADVLVIDDASPDGTGQYCDERAASDPRLKVLHRRGKLGLGSAILASFEYAASRGYDYLVGLDADLSHPPEVIPALLARASGEDGMGGCDVAIGSRYIPGGRVVGWPLRRRISSALVNRFARLLLGIPVRDASGGFRCYRVAALAAVLESGLAARGYSIFEEVLFRLAQRGARFSEVPYTFVDRTQGKSKLSLRETIRAMQALFALALGRLTPSRRQSSADPR